MSDDTRPRYHVLQPLELTADRFNWIRVGTAYQNPDGTIDAFLDAIVVGHRFRLRPYSTEALEDFEGDADAADPERLS